MTEDHEPHLLAAMAEITLIDMTMSADNAVAIALACRGLAPGPHRLAFFLGAMGAVTFRFLFASFVTLFLDVPYLRMLAGIGLLHVAVKMLSDGDGGGEAQDGVPEPKTILQAVRVILMADLLLSFDNSIAVAAAADRDPLLLVLGMLLTAPMLIYGSRFVGLLLDRLPMLVPFGAAVLGWVAGGMFVTDIVIAPWIEAHVPLFHTTGPLLGAGIVMLVHHRRSGRDTTQEQLPALERTTP